MKATQDVLVSVIVPVYKAQQSLSRCVDSILQQTHQNFQLILIDDGSPDNSGAICDEYARRDPRILVVHIPNGGVSNARNTGIGEAKGDYIFFVDADDWLDPIHIQSLLPTANEDFVFGGMRTVNDGIVVSETRPDAISYSMEEQKNRFSLFWHQHAMRSPCCSCYKRHLLNDYNLRFCTSMEVGEDEHFNIRYIAHSSTIRLSNTCTYNYEISDHDSAMQKYHSTRMDDAIKICQAIESVSGKKEYRARWFRWNEVLEHYLKWKKQGDALTKKRAAVMCKKCYQNHYFRECIPYIRQHGSLDEKIRTYCMRSGMEWVYSFVLHFLKTVAHQKRGAV